MTAPSSDLLRDRFPDLVEARGEITVVVRREELLDRLRDLRDDDALSFDFLSDVTATDWPDREPRFWVAYHLSSSTHRHRIRVKVGLGSDDAAVPSAVHLYPAADWFEREVFDLFGIRFDGHPDPRRILLPDDWEGHPLRKDYGIGGVGTQYKGAFIPPVDERSS